MNVTSINNGLVGISDKADTSTNKSHSNHLDRFLKISAITAVASNALAALSAAICVAIGVVALPFSASIVAIGSGVLVGGALTVLSVAMIKHFFGSTSKIQDKNGMEELKKKNNNLNDTILNLKQNVNNLKDRLRKNRKKEKKVKKSPVSTLRMKTNDLNRIMINYIVEENNNKYENDTDSKEKIDARTKEIEGMNNKWEQALSSGQTDHYVARNEKIENLLAQGMLKETFGGSSGIYWIKNPTNQDIRGYVLKDNSGSIFCLNCTVFEKSNGEVVPWSSYDNGEGETTYPRARDSIPLYRDALSEVAYYKIAKQLGLGSYVPETSLHVLKSKSFFKWDEKPTDKNRVEKRRLCSVQTYKQDAPPLSNFAENERNDFFSHKFIEASLFLDMVQGATDRHQGNLILEGSYQTVAKDKFDPTGGGWNIDNGLCHPVKNRQLLMCQVLSENANKPFSDDMIKVMSELVGFKDKNPQELPESAESLESELEDLADWLDDDVVSDSEVGEDDNSNNNVSKKEEIENILKEYELEDTIIAYSERLKLIKWCLEKDSKMTIREMGCRMMLLNKSWEDATREDKVGLTDIPELQKQTTEDGRTRNLKQSALIKSLRRSILIPRITS